MLYGIGSMLGAGIYCFGQLCDGFTPALRHGQGLRPQALGSVHAVRRTPHVAIGVLLAIVVALQFAGYIEQLASAVLLLLFVLVLVNGALVVLKHREGDIAGCFNAPIFAPVLGAAICIVMIVGRVLQDDWRAPAVAGGLITLILLLYALAGPARGKTVIGSLNRAEA